MSDDEGEGKGWSVGEEGIMKNDACFRIFPFVAVRTGASRAVSSYSSTRRGTWLPESSISWSIGSWERQLLQDEWQKKADLSGSDNRDGLGGLVARLSLDRLHLHDNVHALDDMAKDNLDIQCYSHKLDGLRTCLPSSHAVLTVQMKN